MKHTLLLPLLFAVTALAAPPAATPGEVYPKRWNGDYEPHIVIIGSGPTGQGAAWRLFELGYRNWTLVEGTNIQGGLAKTVKDENGFLWDHGVHVLFSHYNYFDTMLDFVLPPKDWYHHVRSSPAWMRGRFVGYPVQNNIWQLPKEDLMLCLEGLTEVHKNAASFSKPKNFQQWLEQSFGKGLAKIFMTPYNFKVWATPTELMNTAWVGERVATIDINKILKNMIFEIPDVMWGPNANFRYPAYGSGQIWDELWRLIPSAHKSMNKKVVAVQTKNRKKKRLVFADNTALQFDYLVNTSPVDKFLDMVVDEPKVRQMANFGWKHQTVNLVGIGVWGQPEAHVNSTYWVYFPEEEFIFYRLTVLSNFSPKMVPHPGKQYSIVVEVSESEYRKVDQSTIVEKTIEGLIKCNFIPKDAKIATKWHERFEYGYPVPYLERDEHMHTADDALRQLGIWSRGRFGSWKYEVANQDHSFMLGVEAVDNILFGSEEVTFRKPDVVNAGKGAGRSINPPRHVKSYGVRPGENGDASKGLGGKGGGGSENGQRTNAKVAPKFLQVDSAELNSIQPGLGSSESFGFVNTAFIVFVLFGVLFAIFQYSKKGNEPAYSRVQA